MCSVFFHDFPELFDGHSVLFSGSVPDHDHIGGLHLVEVDEGEHPGKCGLIGFACRESDSGGGVEMRRESVEDLLLG